MIALKRNSGNKFEPAEYRLVNKDGIELFKENSSAVQEKNGVRTFRTLIMKQELLFVLIPQAE